jgi:succinyl-CoA synthetase beta subunit
MELLEYQAKELFRQVGIPVLPSQQIAQPRDLRGLTLPYPIVLKSQVHTSRRRKAGGIRFVENTIDAMAAAQTIFHLPILGRYPEVVLAEAKYNAEREIYLAIALDSANRRPVLLGSPHGGEEVEAHLDRMQQVIVEQAFSPFYARRLAIKMGLTGPLMQSVSSILEKMYALFAHYDLDLIEINPLGIGKAGEMMALDGKITLNDAALVRHTDLEQLFPTLLHSADRDIAPAWQVNAIELEGSIGVLCNGAGLSLATLDLIDGADGKAAGFVDLGGDYRQGGAFVPLQERLQRGLDLIQQLPNLHVILVNIIGVSVSCLDLAETLVSYLTARLATNPASPEPQLVVRLIGDELALAQTRLAVLQVPVFDRLEEAVARAVVLAKG